MPKERFLEYKYFFDHIYNGQTDSWDYQMLFLCLIQSGLSVVPAKNLITNIGFDANSTNTFSVNDVRANLPTAELQFPLKEPSSIAVDREFENKRYFRIHDRRLPAKVARKLNRWFSDK